MRNKPPKEKSHQRNLISLKVKMMKLVRNQRMKLRLPRLKLRRKRNWSKKQRKELRKPPKKLKHKKEKPPLFHQS